MRARTVDSAVYDLVARFVIKMRDYAIRVVSDLGVMINEVGFGRFGCKAVM